MYETRNNEIYNLFYSLFEEKYIRLDYVAEVR